MAELAGNRLVFLAVSARAGVGQTWTPGLAEQVAATLAASPHTRLKFFAARVQPAFTTGAIPIRCLAVTVFAEVLVGLDLMFQLSNNEFDHDRVIQESESRYMVGNQVFRLRKIGEGV